VLQNNESMNFVVFRLYIPARLGDDHFSAELVKLVPEFFELKLALDVGEAAAVGRDDVTGR